MTLDEWKKIRGEREKPQYNLRKAGEGEDLSQWKNMRELQKEKETEFLENGYNSHHTPKKTDNDKVLRLHLFGCLVILSYDFPF